MKIKYGNNPNPKSILDSSYKIKKVKDDFFDGYIQQLSQDVSKSAEFEIITEIPAADLGIISEVISYASAAIKGEYSYLPV